MIYVPVLKYRQEEKKVLADVHDCISDQIIPLIEIIQDSFPTFYEYEEDGSIKRELSQYSTGKKYYKKVTREPLPDENCTLEEIAHRVKDKNVFVDFYRFDEGEYEKSSIDMSKIKLSFLLSRDINLYIQRVLETNKYEHIMPVISIKEHFEFEKDTLCDIIRGIKKAGKNLAIRVTHELFAHYRAICETELDENDFVMMDVGEEELEPHYMELSALGNSNCKAKKIVLNSPRSYKVTTAQFEETGITELIDNCARDTYLEYDLDGYGDYAGYCNKLPQRQHGLGNVGHAIALMYRYDVNGFEVFKNQGNNGHLGYDNVRDQVLAAEKRLNPDGDCIAYEIIHQNKEKMKSWAAWNRICMVRYIHQIYKYI